MKWNRNYLQLQENLSTCTSYPIVCRYQGEYYMNAAIEADDADPLLQEKVREAMDGLLGVVRILFRKA